MHFIYDLAEHKEVGTEMRWFPRKATLLTEKEKKKKRLLVQIQISLLYSLLF